MLVFGFRMISDAFHWRTKGNTLKTALKKIVLNSTALGDNYVKICSQPSSNLL